MGKPFSLSKVYTCGDTDIGSSNDFLFFVASSGKRADTIVPKSCCAGPLFCVCCPPIKLNIKRESTFNLAWTVRWMLNTRYCSCVLLSPVVCCSDLFVILLVWLNLTQTMMSWSLKAGALLLSYCCISISSDSIIQTASFGEKGSFVIDWSEIWRYERVSSRWWVIKVQLLLLLRFNVRTERQAIQLQPHPHGYL